MYNICVQIYVLYVFARTLLTNCLFVFCAHIADLIYQRSTGEKPFACSFCDRRFSQDHSRKSHEKSQHLKKKQCSN